MWMLTATSWSLVYRYTCERVQALVCRCIFALHLLFTFFSMIVALVGTSGIAAWQYMCYTCIGTRTATCTAVQVSRVYRQTEVEVCSNSYVGIQVYKWYM